MSSEKYFVSKAPDIRIKPAKEIKNDKDGKSKI